MIVVGSIASGLPKRDKPTAYRLGKRDGQLRGKRDCTVAPGPPGRRFCRTVSQLYVLVPTTVRKPSHLANATPALYDTIPKSTTKTSRDAGKSGRQEQPKLQLVVVFRRGVSHIDK